MNTATVEEPVDEQATLSSLDTYIEKRREAARLRDVMSERYRAVNTCEMEERQAALQVEQLEGRIKSLQKSTLLGTVKPGELSTLRQQLTAAKDALSQRRQALDELRDIFLLGQETLSQCMTDLECLRGQLRERLSQLFIQRFVEEDSGLYGKRGQVSWMDPDPNSPARWQKQWRGRVFHFLLNKGFSVDLTENHLLSSIAAFFRSNPFQVSVISGFVPTSARRKAVLVVGELVSVPADLSEAEAFEEISRGRVQFVPEA